MYVPDEKEGVYGCECVDKMMKEEERGVNDMSERMSEGGKGKQLQGGGKKCKR